MTHLCLTEIRKKWDGPFKRPIVIDRETLDLKTGGWAVQVFNKTKAGNISKKGGGHLYLKYCPFCGERLNREMYEEEE